MGAKVQGTFSSNEPKPPLIGSMAKTQQNYYSLRAHEPAPKLTPVLKNPVIIDKNNHVRVTFSNMKNPAISIPGVTHTANPR